MASVELSERASADLLGIYLQGMRQFGPRQADRYLDELEACFQLLADNREMGRRADPVGEGLRRHEHKSHVIFYEPNAKGIFVVAVLHARQLPDLNDP
jgi:toxin ParE1/3/4